MVACLKLDMKVGTHVPHAKQSKSGVLETPKNNNCVPFRTHPVHIEDLRPPAVHENKMTGEKL
jgi:hypothetical protein